MPFFRHETKICLLNKHDFRKRKTLRTSSYVLKKTIGELLIFIKAKTSANNFKSINSSSKILK